MYKFINSFIESDGKIICSTLYFNYKKYIENHHVKRKTIIANMRKCLLSEAFFIEVLAYYCSSL